MTCSICGDSGLIRVDGIDYPCVCVLRAQAIARAAERDEDDGPEGER